MADLSPDRSPDPRPSGDAPAETPADDGRPTRRRWPAPDVLDDLLVGRGGAADADEEDLETPVRPAPLDREPVDEDDDDTREEAGDPPTEQGPPVPVPSRGPVG